MLQPVAPGGDVVTLAFEALALLLDLRVEQCLLSLQQHLLGRA